MAKLPTARPTGRVATGVAKHALLCSIAARFSALFRWESTFAISLYLMLTIFLAQAASPSPAGPSPLASFIPIILIFVIMYFLLFRPQMKRQKEQARVVSTLKTGDRVVTASGIHGMISNVKDRTIILKIADNVKIELEKSAVTTVVKAEA